MKDYVRGELPCRCTVTQLIGEPDTMQLNRDPRCSVNHQLKLIDGLWTVVNPTVALEDVKITLSIAVRIPPFDGLFIHAPPPIPVTSTLI